MLEHARQDVALLGVACVQRERFSKVPPASALQRRSGSVVNVVARVVGPRTSASGRSTRKTRPSGDQHTIWFVAASETKENVLYRNGLTAQSDAAAARERRAQLDTRTARRSDSSAFGPGQAQASPQLRWRRRCCRLLRSSQDPPVPLQALYLAGRTSLRPQDGATARGTANGVVTRRCQHLTA